MPEAQSKEFHVAAADLKKQIDGAPKDSGPRILLGFLYEENGMYDAAACTYEALGKQVGENDWILARKITMLNKLGWDKPDCK
jgi:cytochrome c-type biogenesis protein CcmH/NrfG